MRKLSESEHNWASIFNIPDDDVRSTEASNTTLPKTPFQPNPQVSNKREIHSTAN